MMVPSLSCNIKGAEIYSCLLGRDENTLVKLVEPFHCDFDIEPEKRDTIMAHISHPLLVEVVHMHKLEVSY